MPPNNILLTCDYQKDGRDIAKCIALGAPLGGMAGQFVKAAVSTEKTVEMMKLTKRQIEVTMQTVGVLNFKQMKSANKIVRRNDK